MSHLKLNFSGGTSLQTALSLENLGVVVECDEMYGNIK